MCFSGITFLVAFNGFRRLLSVWLTTDLVLKCNDKPMFHSLLHIVWFVFYFDWNALSSALSHQQLAVNNLSYQQMLGALFEDRFLINKYSCKIVNALPSDVFNVSATTSVAIVEFRRSASSVFVALCLELTNHPKIYFFDKTGAAIVSIRLRQIVKVFFLNNFQGPNDICRNFVTYRPLVYKSQLLWRPYFCFCKTMEKAAFRVYIYICIRREC